MLRSHSYIFPLIVIVHLGIIVPVCPSPSPKLVPKQNAAVSNVQSNLKKFNEHSRTIFIPLPFIPIPRPPAATNVRPTATITAPSPSGTAPLVGVEEEEEIPEELTEEASEEIIEQPAEESEEEETDAK